MEEITLTKEELIQIVEREVSKRLDKQKTLLPSSIFSKVSLKEDEIAKINERFSFTEKIKKPFRHRHYTPISLKSYKRGGGERINTKVYSDEIHGLIRKLTLSAFGVTLNSDLDTKEYSEAAEIYRKIKEYYLHLYSKRISGLTIEDFEGVKSNERYTSW